MSIVAQAAQVRKVKRSQSGMILDPITLPKNATIGEANEIMRENKIGGIPIVDKDGILIGIVTNRDLRFLTDMSLLVDDVMSKGNLITVNEGIDLAAAEEVLKQHKVEKLPIVNAKGVLKGLVTYKDILKKRDRPYA